MISDSAKSLAALFFQATELANSMDGSWARQGFRRGDGDLYETTYNGPYGWAWEGARNTLVLAFEEDGFADADELATEMMTRIIGDTCGAIEADEVGRYYFDVTHQRYQAQG